MILSRPPVTKGANCARIAYDNLIALSDGSIASRAATPNTYERWTSPGDVGMTGVFNLTDEGDVSCIGIAAHNLFSSGVTSVIVATDLNDENWMNIATIQIESDDPILVTLDSTVTAQRVRFNVVGGTAGETKEIGVVFAGEYMIMEQPIYGGHSPQKLRAITDYQSTQSETGQFLGRSITRKGTETTFSWRHLTPSFVYSEFFAFMESAKTLPFFIKWRPDLYPDDVSYCYTTSDISPSNMGGGHQLMNVDVQVRGHKD